MRIAPDPTQQAPRPTTRTGCEACATNQGLSTMIQALAPRMPRGYSWAWLSIVLISVLASAVAAQPKDQPGSTKKADAPGPSKKKKADEPAEKKSDEAPA